MSTDDYNPEEYYAVNGPDNCVDNCCPNGNCNDSDHYSYDEVAGMIANDPEYLIDIMNAVLHAQQRVLDLINQYDKLVVGEFADATNFTGGNIYSEYDEVVINHPTPQTLKFKLTVTDEPITAEDKEIMKQFIQAIDMVRGKLERRESIAPEELMCLDNGIMSIV